MSSSRSPSTPPGPPDSGQIVLGSREVGAATPSAKPPRPEGTALAETPGRGSGAQRTNEDVGLEEVRLVDAEFPDDRQAIDDSEPVESAVHVFAPTAGAFSPDDYAVGKVISGRFRVEHVIGVGSMGVVLAARHLELDERVAIKFIRAEVQKLPGVLSRFAREAKAAVSIKSEHVAQVFDVGTADGIGPYIVMEYLEGQDLGAYLEEFGALSVRQAVHYVMQACEALAVAHAAGITHRDIKPENLYLTRQGDLELIKLLDFGISKASLAGRVFGDELSKSDNSCMLGTPLYMSPEQIRSTSEVDHRSDIWSLGAVLYELVSARSAFAADNVGDVLRSILEASPEPLSVHLEQVAPALQAVIDRCLDKDPNARFQDVADLAMALLPFAPSRARAYAQRTASILGHWHDSGFPEDFAEALLPSLPSEPEETEGPTSERTPVASLTPDVSAPPVAAVREASIEAPRRRRFWMIPLAAFALVLLASYPTLKRIGEAGPSSQRPRVAVARPAAAVVDEVAVEPRIDAERSVRVESQPAGAEVQVDGKAMGITPVSLRLPPGWAEVSVSKQGYQAQSKSVDVVAAAPGASPLFHRFVLAPEAGSRATSVSASATRRSSSARRASARRRHRRKSSEPALAAVRAAPAGAAPDGRSPSATVPKDDPKPKAPLLEAPPGRVRLLDDRRPSRLLD